jgi:hypothetical protein
MAWASGPTRRGGRSEVLALSHEHRSLAICEPRLAVAVLMAAGTRIATKTTARKPRRTVEGIITIKAFPLVTPLNVAGMARHGTSTQQGAAPSFAARLFDLDRGAVNVGLGVRNER